MGVLKARVGSSWQAIGTGVGEVFVGPNDPGTNVGIELWYDSDDNSVIAASTVGLEANRPAAIPANAGLHYFTTDTLREWLCDGTGWIILSEPTQTWTPGLTSVTVGNGVNLGSTMRSNGWCDFLGLVWVGSTGNVTGDFRVNLPYPSGSGDNVASYKAHVLQSGVQEHPCFVASNVANTFAVRGINTAGTTAVQAPFNATTPFTWLGSSAYVYFGGKYPMASRYS